MIDSVPPSKSPLPLDGLYIHLHSRTPVDHTRHPWRCQVTTAAGGILLSFLFLPPGGGRRMPLTVRRGLPDPKESHREGGSAILEPRCKLFSFNLWVASPSGTEPVGSLGMTFLSSWWWWQSRLLFSFFIGNVFGFVRLIPRRFGDDRF